MSTAAIRDLAKAVKESAPLLGLMADKAVIEAGDIQRAARIIMTPLGGDVPADEYRWARELLTAIAQETQ